MPRILTTSLFLGVAWLNSLLSAAPPPSFEAHVRPILKAHCFQCHGEEGEPQGGLDLRLVRLMVRGGDSGAALVSGNAAGSLIVERVASGEMPPGKTKLSAEEVELIRRWVNDGARTARPEPANVDQAEFTAEERAFWSFQPIIARPAPEVKNQALARTPIDNFVLHRLEAEGLSFSLAADPATLVRRAYFDLWGLPPTPEQIDAFLADARPDSWERLLDALLASPHYGERWGRHWLDVAGYADSDGYGDKDIERPFAYRYRDYVIRSFNEDKPFDLFIQEQLAGDELSAASYGRFGPEDADRLIATGFLRMGPDGTGDAEAEQDVARHDVLVETVKIVSTSLLGLSVGCAQCHNHRFDPISHVDYHRLRAVFEPAYNVSAWRKPEERTVALQTPEERRALEEVEAKLAALAQERDAALRRRMAPLLEARIAELPAAVREEVGEAARKAVLERPAGVKPTDEQAALLRKYPRLRVTESDVRRSDPKGYAEELKAYETKVAELKATGPTRFLVSALTEVPGATPKSHLFRRGDFRQPAQEVAPGELSILVPDGGAVVPSDDPSLPTSGRRLAYARHLTDGAHPLTARVLANRFWLHHFGRGLVGTPAEFGVQGERPTHPELLDWLAAHFMRGGWSLKSMHKQILMSSVYRQASRRNAVVDQADPDNRLLSRANVRRLEAEAVRDAMLSVAGSLNVKMHGPPLPVSPDGVGQVVLGVPAASRDGRVIPLKSNEDSRRSVYIQMRRSLPLGMLETFDAPSMTPNCEVRTSSTVAPQALLLMNNDEVLTIARRFAARVMRDAGSDEREQVRRAWRLALGASPTPLEVDRAVRFLGEQKSRFAARAPAAGKSDSPDDPPRLALATFCQFLISSNAFLYVD